MIRHQYSKLLLVVLFCILFICKYSATHVIYPTTQHPVLYATSISHIENIPEHPDVDENVFMLGYKFDSFDVSKSGKIDDLRCVLYDAGYNSTILTQFVVSNVDQQKAGEEYYITETQFQFPIDFSNILSIRCAITFSVIPPRDVLSYVSFSLHRFNRIGDEYTNTLINNISLISLSSWNDKPFIERMLHLPQQQYLAALTDGYNTRIPKVIHNSYNEYLKSTDYVPLSWPFAIDNTRLAHTVLKSTHEEDAIINAIRISTVGRGWLTSHNSMGDGNCHFNGFPLSATLNTNNNKNKNEDTPSIWIDIRKKNYYLWDNQDYIAQALFPELALTVDYNEFPPDLLGNIESLKPAHILTVNCGESFPLVLPQNVDQDDDIWSKTQINNNNNNSINVEKQQKPIHLSDVIMSIEFGFINYDEPDPKLRHFTPRHEFGQGTAHLTTNPQQEQEQQQQQSTLINSQTQFGNKPYLYDTDIVQPPTVAFAVNPTQQYDQLSCSTMLSFGHNLGIKPFLRQTEDTILIDDKELVYITFPKLPEFKVANGTFNNTYDLNAENRPEYNADENSLIRNTMVTITLLIGNNDKTIQKKVSSILIVPTATDDSSSSSTWIQNDDYMQLAVEFSTSHFFPNWSINEIKEFALNYENVDIGMTIEVFVYGRFVNRNIVKNINNSAIKSLQTTQCIFEYHHNRHTTNHPSINIFTSILPMSYLHQHLIGNVSSTSTSLTMSNNNNYNNNNNNNPKNDTRNIIELQYIGLDKYGIIFRTINHHMIYGIEKIITGWSSPSFIPFTTNLDIECKLVPNSFSSGEIKSNLDTPTQRLSTIEYSFIRNYEFYVFEHIASRFNWDNYHYQTIEQLNDDWILLKQDGSKILNQTIKLSTLQNIPIIYRQNVQLEIQEVYYTRHLTQIPMMFTLHPNEVFTITHDVSSTIGTKPSYETPLPPDHHNDDNDKDKESTNIFLILFLIVIIILIVVFVVYIYRHKTSIMLRISNFINNNITTKKSTFNQQEQLLTLSSINTIDSNDDYHNQQQQVGDEDQQHEHEHGQQILPYAPVV